MTRFKFRLEKLQRLAERTAREAASRFSDARRVLSDRQHAQESIEQARARRGRPCPEPGTRVRADVLAAMNTHLVKLTADVKRAAAASRAQALTVEQKRQEFVRAKREQRKFELLRERRFEEWRIEMNRKEQRALDETASHRYKPPAWTQTADIAESHGKPGRNI